MAEQDNDINIEEMYKKIITYEATEWLKKDIKQTREKYTTNKS